MSEARLDNRLRRHRKAHGLSQHVLAERSGVSRQAVLAIEAGKRVPSTELALRLAHVLKCAVEDLFQLVPTPGIHARLASLPLGLTAGSATRNRVALGRIEGNWAAHRLSADGTTAADGIVESEAPGRPGSPDSIAVVQPLASTNDLERNILVAGCAPLLGAVAHRVSQRFADARVTWLRAGSQRALDLLAAGMVHVAGVHLSGVSTGGGNLAAIRRALPGRQLLVVNLTRWRQGLVVLPGNPLGIDGGADLLRPELRLAHREEGSGAYALAARFLEPESGRAACSPLLRGPLAQDHGEVARLVRWRSADTGIAIEGAALAEGLGFVPLAQERFDLVVPTALAMVPPVSRLIETLDNPGFRVETAYLPGYDGSLSGQVTRVEAA